MWKVEVNSRIRNDWLEQLLGASWRSKNVAWIGFIDLVQSEQIQNPEENGVEGGEWALLQSFTSDKWIGDEDLCEISFSCFFSDPSD